MVALSVTRLLNTGGRVFVHGMKGTLEDRLGELLKQTAEQLCSSWRPPDPGTIGLVWHVITSAFDTGQALLGVAGQLNVQATSPPGSEDQLLFKKLVDGIQPVGKAESQP